MSANIPSYRLKIERAKRHIGELAAEIQAFHSRSPYAVITEIEPETGDKLLKLSIREKIPARWSPIIGDAVHNIRSALDLLLCAVVRQCDPTRQSLKHVHFVVRETKEEFETALPERIKGASPEVIQLIHDLKPYKAGNEALWRVHRLDILDKHQAIIPVWSQYAGWNIGPMMHAAVMSLWNSRPDAPKSDLPATDFWLTPEGGRGAALYDGAELARIKAVAISPFDNQNQFRIEIAFGQTQILDGEPVVPALTQLADYVAGVFEPFEAVMLR